MTSTINRRGQTATFTYYVLDATFDSRDQRTLLLMQAPWSRAIGYRYNAEMQLDTLIDMWGGRTKISYDADRMPVSVTLPTGLIESLGYPSTHRRGSLRYSDPTIDHWVGQAFRHDAPSRAAERVNIYADTSRSFSYDAVGRVTGFTNHYNTTPSCAWNADTGQQCSYGSQTTLAGGESYSYDRVGIPTHDGAITGTRNRLTKFKGWTMEYDLDGNLTRRYFADGYGTVVVDIRAYWNALGQMDSTKLLNLQGTGCTFRFGYDGWGRRIRTGCAASGKEVRFVWDGDDVLLEADAVTGALIAEYTYWSGIDNPHSIRRGGAADSVFYYLADGTGSVAGLVNTSNQLIDIHRWRPFGLLDASSSNVPSRLGFHGAAHDGNFIYLRNRWYDPLLHRFLSEDPIGLAAASTRTATRGTTPIATGIRAGCTWVGYSTPQEMRLARWGMRLPMPERRFGTTRLAQLPASERSHC